MLKSLPPPPPPPHTHKKLPPTPTTAHPPPKPRPCRASARRSSCWPPSALIPSSHPASRPRGDVQPPVPQQPSSPTQAPLRRRPRPSATSGLGARPGAVGQAAGSCAAAAAARWRAARRAAAMPAARVTLPTEMMTQTTQMTTRTPGPPTGHGGMATGTTLANGSGVPREPRARARRRRHRRRRLLLCAATARANRCCGRWRSRAGRHWWCALLPSCSSGRMSCASTSCRVSPALLGVSCCFAVPPAVLQCLLLFCSASCRCWPAAHPAWPGLCGQGYGGADCERPSATPPLPLLLQVP